MMKLRPEIGGRRISGILDRRHITDGALVVMGFILVCLIVFAMYMSSRLRETYNTITEVTLLRADLANHKSEADRKMQDLAKEIVDVEKTVYGPLTAVLRRPGIGEQGQLNTNKELRERLKKLELDSFLSIGNKK